MVTLEVERPSEAAEQPDAKRRGLDGKARRRLLEQLRGPLIDDPGPPASLLVTDRRFAQQLGVGKVAGDLRGGSERCKRIERATGTVARHSELEEDGGAQGRILDPELERDAQVRRSLVEGKRCGGGVRGAQVVLDPASAAAERPRLGEVMREIDEHPARLILALRQGLANAKVKLRAPDRGESVIERPANELVGEPVAKPE